MTTGSVAPYVRRCPLRALRTAFRGLRSSHLRFGDPEFSRSEARSFSEKVGEGSIQATKRSLSDESKERLVRLGYREHIRDE
ncbi:hypothetical protein BRD00_13140 [Halobacteriales archaeon QS_8_69_26]|nr:MAG: hypothetical protein BRD00_13140 [Halobacteriales archaeon QS_8_69_26]